MEEIITISKSELQALIAKEIANRTVKAMRDFREVKIESGDIESINRLYPDVFNKMRLPFYNRFSNDQMPINDTRRCDNNTGDTSKIFSNTRHFHKSKNAYYHSKASLYESNIHELLKGLTLALHGGTIIKDLDDKEFQEALETYNEFKHFFLDRYSVRLSKLEE